ncbi:MAG: CapA family protein [Faecousia sp.]
MARQDDEMNKRRQRREEMRQKQAQEQKRMKAGLITAAALLVVCAVVLMAMIRDTGIGSDDAPKETQASTKETAAPETKPQSWAEQNTTSTIHIRAAGDLNITDSVVKSGLSATGYEFTRSFIDVVPILSDADLTVMNLEGNIVGEPYGTDRVSAPIQLLESLRGAGVDLIQMANSTAINNGLIGLNSTLQAIHSSGMEPLGAYATKDDFQRAKGYTICEAQGIKVAFVAFTKGMGGMGLPDGSEDCINLLYKDYDSEYRTVDTEGITRILKNVASEKPDIIIAMLHWGSEGTDTISDSQERIVNLMKKNGVDVIIGTHPHRVHQIDFDKASGTLVAYSLGDFFGDATAGGSNYSIILDIEITKDNHAGVTRVTNYSYTPIYTLKETDCVDGDRRVVRIYQAMQAYENGFVDSITKSCYEDMKYSLTRIEDRISGKYLKTDDEKSK